jgi:hypothetical protein
MTSPASPAPKAKHRRGALYVAVLGVAMIVSLIALAGIHLGRVETDVLSGAEQVAQAELLAQSAVEIALARIKTNSSWRTTYASGTEVPSSGWTTLGGGGVRFALVDSDGNLADDLRDSVTVRGIGRYGEATQVVTVQIHPAGDALDCLDFAVHSSGTLTNISTITTDSVVTCNSNIANSGATINGDAWATGTINGTVSGASNPNMTPARQAPNTESVWEYYLANGTYIDVDDIPANTIALAVISPLSNPYGAENSQGIYIIDCHGELLTITNSRIQATLVVINSNPGVVLQGALNWEPPAAHMPALMVAGNLQLNWAGGTPLTELTLLTNFNPSGGLLLGLLDLDILDTYPGTITGLVYASGNIWASNDVVITGGLVANGVSLCSDTANVTYSSTLSTTPPPGFSIGNVMRVIPRTWKRAAR